MTGWRRGERKGAGKPLMRQIQFEWQIMSQVKIIKILCVITGETDPSFSLKGRACAFSFHRGGHEMGRDSCRWALSPKGSTPCSSPYTEV